jgi:predicted nucleic acid-binding protein
MIVVDTNTIAYLYLPTEYTASVEKLLEVAPQWVAPTLWRSEFRNILALYIRKEILDFATASEMQTQAEALLKDHEYDVDSFSVLELAAQFECSAYDAEFVVLAKSLGTKLVTGDKKLLKLFPESAITARDYVASTD